MSEYQKSLLRRCLVQLKSEIEFCGPCEHDAGVCICDLIQLADEIDAEISPPANWELVDGLMVFNKGDSTMWGTVGFSQKHELLGKIPTLEIEYYDIETNEILFKETSENYMEGFQYYDPSKGQWRGGLDQDSIKVRRRFVPNLDQEALLNSVGRRKLAVVIKADCRGLERNRVTGFMQYPQSS